MNTNNENIDATLKKIMHFCAYRERCVYEVYLKLKSFGCNDPQCIDIIQFLQKENFIDDERYAKNFAESKFKINKWGKIKIVNALKQKKISDNIINLSINAIDPDEYNKLLYNIVEKKIKDLKITEFNETNILKVQNYALQKGFEKNLIINTIKNIIRK